MIGRRSPSHWLVCFSVTVAVATIVLLVVAVPGVGYAQALKCERDWLEKDDEMTLRAAALKVLPKSVDMVITRGCRTADWTYGFIETQKNITGEGVQQWYEFTCRRKRQPWICDPPEFKQFISTSIVVGTVSHQWN